MLNIFKLGLFRGPWGTIEVDANFPDMKQWDLVGSSQCLFSWACSGRGVPRRRDPCKWRQGDRGSCCSFLHVATAAVVTPVLAFHPAALSALAALSKRSLLAAHLALRLSNQQPPALSPRMCFIPSAYWRYTHDAYACRWLLHCSTNDVFVHPGYPLHGP